MSDISSSSLGWSGNIPNQASSSRPPREPSSTAPSNLASGQRSSNAADDLALAAFAEKFKYLVCSSGILEKDHVPARRGRSNTQTGSGLAEDGNGGDPDPDPGPGTLSTTSSASIAQDRVRLVIANSRQRPDIALAGLVLLGAIVRVVGLKVFSTLLVGIVTIASVILWLRYPNIVPALSQLETNESMDIEVVSQEREPNALAIDMLQEFLTTSGSLDQIIDSSLSLLQEHPDVEEYHALRVAIHRLYDQMTDQLASATSTFLEMVDKQELGVLGDMYDIPVAGSFLYPRHGLGRPSQDTSNVGDDASALPSPKRLSWNSSNPLIPLSLPMAASSSMPNRLNPNRKYPLHASMSGIPMDDRYTSLPPRTPRASKRSSWAPEWNDRIKSGFDSERRITESHESSPIIGPTEPIEDRQSLSVGPGSPSPKIAQFTPRRSSPLSRADLIEIASADPQRHIIPIIPPTPEKRDLMASPMIKSPIRSDSKRQSLQGMPYYRSDQSDLSSPGKASIPGGTGGLRRVPSLQYSDLQMLREQSTRGSRRPSISIISPFAPSSIPLLAAMTQPIERPKRQRIPSLSPLTLPALKAACLGLHMKRRRMACCLLGLKFHDQDEVYWSTARETLQELSNAIKGAVTDLEAVLDVAKATPVTHSVKETTSLPPPWTVDIESTGIADFAPRTSDHTTLMHHVETMERALATAWAEVQAVKRAAGQADGLTEQWGKVRGSIGQLVREWERGKDHVLKINPAPVTSPEIDTLETEHGQPPPLPSFMKAWNDDENATPDASFTSVEDTDTSSEYPIDHDSDTLSRTELLPPPGHDLVFESQPVPITGLPIERSKLSREDRIRLMKEARDKGMTLGEMLHQRDNGGSGESESARQMMQMGGEVVGELKGMIGIIRRRKGLDEHDHGPPTSTPNPSALSPTKSETRSGRQSPIRLSKPISSECLRPPAGFAEDLRKAFVFPTPRVNSHDDR